MAWYDEAVFYHIYPLGLTGAPKENSYSAPESRLKDLHPWVHHIKNLGCNALYIGPLFESVGHGYETTDYSRVDSRLGTNQDLKELVQLCHDNGIRVILDGVFNHVGRDFHAFKDVQRNRESSPYRDWFCNLNFYGNNEYNDGFSYANWGGYNLLVKLNQQNPAVQDFICHTVENWVKEFDIDGLRLDAADVLDFGFMHRLRETANWIKPDFWLMGEVIHGDYSRWANREELHSVTNYNLYKALYSGHNDHNYFEIAHTVKRLYDMGGGTPDGLKLYNFTDNHDVERIINKLNNRAHYTPVHILLYTLPGIPSIYYGSEFGIEGRKERGSDASLRPCLNLQDFKEAITDSPYTSLIAKLGRIHQNVKALSYGDYRQLLLTNRQYAYARGYDGEDVIVTVNNDDSDYVMTLPCSNVGEYVGALSGQRVSVNNGTICVNVKANSGDIWIPAHQADFLFETPQYDSIDPQALEPQPKQQEEVEETAEDLILEEENEVISEKIQEEEQEEKAQEEEQITLEELGSVDFDVNPKEEPEETGEEETPAEKSEEPEETAESVEKAEKQNEDPISKEQDAFLIEQNETQEAQQPVKPAILNLPAEEQTPADAIEPVAQEDMEAAPVEVVTFEESLEAPIPLKPNPEAKQEEQDEPHPGEKNAAKPKKPKKPAAPKPGGKKVEHKTHTTKIGKTAPHPLDPPVPPQLPPHVEVVSDQVIHKISGSSDVPKEPKNPFVPNPQDEAHIFDRGVIAGLQEAVLALLSKNGPITDQMRKDVEENVWHDSLINWIKSFR